jgi:hypothetical protein
MKMESRLTDENATMDMRESEGKVSRRSFLQVTGLAVGTVAALSAFGCSPVTSENVSNNTPDDTEANPPSDTDLNASGATNDTTNDTEIVDDLKNRATLHGLADSMYDPDKTVPDTMIELILRAGFSAPSAVGQTSLEFVVVKSREIMMSLHIDGENGNANQANSAPLFIVLVEHDIEDARSRFYQYDSGLAAMAMQVEASHLGLCSCVMSMKDTGDYSALKVDETYHPQLMLSFGYPAQDATSSASVDNYNPSRIHQETL